MDFLDPKKKRAYKIRLYIGYVLMAIALSIGTLILLYEAYGYDLNRQTGEVIQNGLVFVDSQPEASRIFINGKYETDTGARLVLPSGQYTIRLERDGYRPWERTFELEGSAIERLSYPFIFPEELQPTDARQYDSMPYFASQSPDRRWLLLQHSGQLNSLDVIDLNNKETPTQTITLPDGVVTAAAGNHKLSMLEWSTDNRHVLLKHSFQGGVEFIMVDREVPAESFNVNRTFAEISLANVALLDKSFDRLYLLDKGGTLHTANVSSGETTSLAVLVRAFKGYGADTVLYVTEEGAPDNKALVMTRRGDNTYKLRELSKNDSYVVDIARYDGRWYMAAGAAAEKRVFVYRDAFDLIARENPRTPAPVSVLQASKPEYLSFSTNAQFIGVQSGSEFSVYDAEHDRQYRYDTKLKLPAGYKAIWMDGHRYLAVSQGQAVVFDYDGINMQRLTAANPAFTPLFDRNYDFLYTIGPSVDQEASAALLQTPLRTPEDQ